ncbi:MAG: hypothetical protein HUU38_06260 [Anaerolineales bacterium]|nr:hypothetical protein [Anaerolineales bacterium]
MSIIVRMLPDIEVLYVMVYGSCLLSEMFTLASAPEHDPANRPRMKLIIDYLHADLEIDTEGVQAGVTFLRDLDQTGFEMEPTAILTRNDGIAMFFNALDFLVNKKDDIRQVFKSLDEAIAWLDMTEHTQAIHQIHDELLAQVRAEAFK